MKLKLLIGIPLFLFLVGGVLVFLFVKQKIAEYIPNFPTPEQAKADYLAAGFPWTETDLITNRQVNPNNGVDTRNAFNRLTSSSEPVHEAQIEVSSGRFRAAQIIIEKHSKDLNRAKKLLASKRVYFRRGAADHIYQAGVADMKGFVLLSCLQGEMLAKQGRTYEAVNCYQTACNVEHLNLEPGDPIWDIVRNAMIHIIRGSMSRSAYYLRNTPLAIGSLRELSDSMTNPLDIKKQALEFALQDLRICRNWPPGSSNNDESTGWASDPVIKKDQIAVMEFYVSLSKGVSNNWNSASATKVGLKNASIWQNWLRFGGGPLGKHCNVSDYSDIFTGPYREANAADLVARIFFTAAAWNQKHGMPPKRLDQLVGKKELGEFADVIDFDSWHGGFSVSATWDRPDYAPGKHSSPFYCGASFPPGSHDRL